MVHPGNWTPGCDRNFTAQSCQSNDVYNEYTVEELANTIWEDVSYSVLQSTVQEDCQQACSEDCNCEAALFIGSTCRKQRLPLRYGRRKLDDSSIAFIKVGVTAPINAPGNMPKGNKRYLRVDILIVSVFFIAFGSMMLVISGIVFYKNHFWYRKLSCNGHFELGEDFAPRSFMYSELEQMTGGFKEELGRGSFGTVYKGEILNGRKVVAVKKLEKVLAEGEREFQTEMKVIGRTHHRNLVRLLGYCHDGIQRLLVYEYMSNGSLRIHSSRQKNNLVGMKECELLETSQEESFIFTKSNIMDDNGCAKISDFGLAKLLTQDQTRTYTGIRGTRGYVAPEWHRKLPITVKADVYSYGIVLLEIICCRKSVEMNLPEEEAILEEWVYQRFEDGDLDKLLGDEAVDKKQLERMVKLGNLVHSG
ncbi:G-type lectin S-receptor-like serine/threonine-protein kinase RLK1 [Morella rubra]|uniref:non-specific serine/threonine protein kinase n=1 Tax=Morella rubra TaxID=262757 RepID=A0A6A1WDU7_9ROSI|nr:G-type lectin S-receptor-like serine/threonine-protein kinase RLK1 [Morella rubra]